MKKIIFENFKHDVNRIDFQAKIIEDEDIIKVDEIFFEFNREITINDNILSVALSTLCGRTFDYIYFELDLNEDLLNDISKFTGANVSSKSTNDLPFLKEKKDKILINFSGGMDSLAGYLILPKDIVELVAIDFTRFEREINFFKKFKPFTVRTNFRELGYNKNTQKFMGVGAILFNEIINANYQIFGTIMEAGVGYSIERYGSRNNFPSEPFTYVGINDVKITEGLNEIGTALIICNLAPYLINDSLISLSPVGTSKRYRKELIVKILIDKFKFDNVFVEYTQNPEQNWVLKWGDKFPNDFLVLYWIKHADINDISKLTIDIPSDVFEFVESHSLDFYEKFNTNYLNNIPPIFKKDVVKNLVNAGIYPYNEADFRELNEVMKFLSKYHPNISSML